jgi:hypothetical protein
VSPSPLVLLSAAAAEEESALPKSTKLGQILVLHRFSKKYNQSALTQSTSLGQVFDFKAFNVLAITHPQSNVALTLLPLCTE